MPVMPNSPWAGLFEEKVVATPEFIRHCIEKCGEHLRGAENTTGHETRFKRHIELVEAYASVLRAIL